MTCRVRVPVCVPAPPGVFLPVSTEAKKGEFLCWTSLCGSQNGQGVHAEGAHGGADGPGHGLEGLESKSRSRFSFQLSFQFSFQPFYPHVYCNMCWDFPIRHWRLRLACKSFCAHAQRSHGGHRPERHVMATTLSISTLTLGATTAALAASRSSTIAAATSPTTLAAAADATAADAAAALAAAALASATASSASVALAVSAPAPPQQRC